VGLVASLKGLLQFARCAKASRFLEMLLLLEQRGDLGLALFAHFSKQLLRCEAMRFLDEFAFLDLAVGLLLHELNLVRIATEKKASEEIP
jgi:hypothetical protein